MPPKKNQKPTTPSQKSTSSEVMRKQKAWQTPYTPIIVTPYPRASELRERVKRRKFASVVGPAVTEDRTTFESYSQKQSQYPRHKNQPQQRNLPMPMPMGVPQPPKLNDGKKLRVIDENPSPPVSSKALPKPPEIGLLVSFIEEAGELADGKRQEDLMKEVIAQFGAYLLYVDDVETKVVNLKKAYDHLLSIKRLAVQ